MLSCVVLSYVIRHAFYLCMYGLLPGQESDILVIAPYTRKKNKNTQRHSLLLNNTNEGGGGPTLLGEIFVLSFLMGAALASSMQLETWGPPAPFPCGLFWRGGFSCDGNSLTHTQPWAGMLVKGINPRKKPFTSCQV